MFGNLLHFSGYISRFMPRFKDITRRRDYADLGHATRMVEAKKCPECDNFMTLTCMEGDENAVHTDRCCKCGALWQFDETGKKLVMFAGFYEPIRSHYLHVLRMEQAQAFETRRTTPQMHFSRAVADEIESMQRHEELTRLSTYQLDQQIRKAA